MSNHIIGLGTKNGLLFLAKEIWGLYASLRTNFILFIYFAWEEVWGKILIVDMLMKRGWSMVNRCSLCKDNEESMDHILIHCGKTKELWTLLLSSFGMVWVFPASVRNLLMEWKVQGLEKKRRVVWWLTPICSFWCIWEKQNRTFQEEEMLDLALGTSFFSLLVVSTVFGFRLFLFSKFFGWLTWWLVFLPL